MTDSPSPARPRPPRRRLVLVLASVVGVVVLCGCLALLTGIVRFGKESPPECRAASAALARLDPFIHGEVAAMNLTRPVRLMPPLTFKTADGQSKTLADFKGRMVLFNLWATWCVPCRKEMPALDKLQAKLGGDDFQVVAVNIDTTRLDRPKAFLQEIGVTNLPLYTDSDATVFQVLRTEGQALGLPTTLLVDRNGCEIGNMAGPAEWDSVDAEKLVKAASERS